MSKICEGKNHFYPLLSIICKTMYWYSTLYTIYLKRYFLADVSGLCSYIFADVYASTALARNSKVFQFKYHLLLWPQLFFCSTLTGQEPCQAFPCYWLDTWLFYVFKVFSLNISSRGAEVAVVINFKGRKRLLSIVFLVSIAEVFTSIIDNRVRWIGCRTSV